MRMLDAERKQDVRVLQLYLSPEEAAEMREKLSVLLADAEAVEHAHVISKDGSRDLSFSIVTPQKLASGRYTTLEQSIFEER